MKILFCTDGSNISFNAMKNFSHWAKCGIVDIVCVIDWSFLPDSAAIEDSNFVMQCTNTADEILDNAERLLTSHEIVAGEKLKLCGTVIDGILEICDKKDYDYIVLGSHGKKGIQKWLGSVSQEIASAVKIPVYISKLSNECKKVLITVDGTEKSKLCVEKLLNTMNLQDKNLHLLTVYEMPDFLFLKGNVDSNWLLEIQNKQEVAAMLTLNEIETLLKDNGLENYQKTITQGIPATEILKYATSNNIDLIVCGNKNYKKLSKFLLGSVSLRVLENTDSDVLIIK